MPLVVFLGDWLSSFFFKANVSTENVTKANNKQMPHVSALQVKVCIVICMKILLFFSPR